MRSLIVKIFATAISFYVAGLVIAGFKLDNTWQTYLLASLIFVVINGVIGPLVKLLLLPLNLLTLGLFRWLSNVIVLYLFDLLYDGLTITGYRFPGFTSGLISLGPTNLNLFWTLVLSSFAISLTYSVISSLLSPE